MVESTPSSLELKKLIQWAPLPSLISMRWAICNTELIVPVNSWLQNERADGRRKKERKRTTVMNCEVLLSGQITWTSHLFANSLEKVIEKTDPKKVTKKQLGKKWLKRRLNWTSLWEVFLIGRTADFLEQVIEKTDPKKVTKKQLGKKWLKRRLIWTSLWEVFLIDRTAEDSFSTNITATCGRNAAFASDDEGQDLAYYII